MGRRSELLWWLVPALLIAAAAYQLALALDSSGIGAEPGAGPAGEWIVRWIAFLTMLAGAGAAGLAVLAPPTPWALASYGPAAAAVLVTRFYEYDPYYAPSLRRFSEDGNISAFQVFAVAGIGIAAGVLTAFVRRTGAILTIVALVLMGFTSFLVGIGH